MVRNVTKIPAWMNPQTAAPIDARVRRKVAGYARVSTDHDEQQTSYEAQLDYYTNLIQGNENWEFAGMYSDEGMTGTSTKKREGFQTMVADALAGKIDLILTKSVSRFARNTVDSLSTIRLLKDTPHSTGGSVQLYMLVREFDVRGHGLGHGDAEYTTHSEPGPIACFVDGVLQHDLILAVQGLGHRAG